MADSEDQNNFVDGEGGNEFGAEYEDYNMAPQDYDEANEAHDGNENTDEQLLQQPEGHDAEVEEHVDLDPATCTEFAAEESSEVTKTLTASRNDDDERKIFVGGLHWETTVSDLKEYFQKYGKVVDCTLKTDPNTGRSRGFGFVLFDNIEAVDKVVAEKSHVLQGKTIDPKRAMARGGKDPVKKIFVGGINPDTPETEIREFFSKFGKIDEVELPFDRMKNQRRAYVFITFESEEVAEKACAEAKQKLGDKEVDVRKATPRTEQDGSRGRGGFSQRGRGAYDATGVTAQPGYDYSSYYGYGYGYPGYGYDYSSYYGADWSQYAQGYGQAYGYPGYDYSSWYGQDPSGQQATAAVAGAYGKTKRGTSTPGYHPYSR